MSSADANRDRAPAVSSLAAPRSWFFSRLGIRTQMLGVALISLVPMGILAGYQIHEEMVAARQGIEQTATTIAQINAAEISRVLRVTEKFLEDLAQNPDVKALDRRRCGHLFDHFVDLYPHHSNLLTKDLDGRPICSALPVPDGARIDRQYYLEGVLNTQRFSIGGANLGPVSKRWVVPLDYPIRNDSGAIIGTISAPLDLLNFNPFVGADGFRALPPGTMASLYAPDMTLLARSLEPEKWVGTKRTDTPALVELVAKRSGTTRFVSGIDHVERIHAAAPVAGTPWTTLANIPTASFDAAINVLIGKWLAIGLVVSAMSLGLAYVLAIHTARPILEIATVAEAVGRGSTDRRARVAGNIEAVTVAAAVNGMLDRLQRQKDELAASGERYRELFLAAREASRTKSAFLAMMSHELRTPMTGVLGMTDFLSETSLDETQRSYVDTLRSSAKTLLEVLNDILDYSKIETDRLALDCVPFDAVALVGETVRLFRPKAQDQGCVLAVESDGIARLMVTGDPTRIKQVLGNLVGNATKFTKEGEIAVRLTQDLFGARRRLRFEVEDTGIGIAESDMGRLFQPFSQLDTGTTRAYGGTGLGLAISKRLVERMGGEIGATSQLGRGSVFWFTCLVDEGGPAESTPAPGPLPAVQSLTILLAEDNPINRMIVKVGLEQRGHRVLVAENGVEAYQAATRRRFDLIVMDMQMPVMDGGEATRRIRALPTPFSEVPIVALTADALTEHRSGYMAAGLTDFLTKPVDWVQVDALLVRHARAPSASAPALALVDRDGDGDGDGGDDSGDQALPLVEPKRLHDVHDLMTGADFAVLLEEFASCSASRMSDLRDAVARHDLTATARIAHDIKGMFSNIGALRAEALARRLQEAQDVAAAAAILPMVAATTEDTVAELDRLFAAAPDV